MRYFALFDDEMVSMRYAANLVHHGELSWNPGERVEGFTNPLWVLFMAALHLLPVAKSKLSLLVELTGALCLLVNLVYVRRIADHVSGGSRRVTICAVVFTASYLSLNFWALRGTEVGLLTPMVSAGVWKLLKQEEQPDRLPISLYLLLGTATLVRMDMAVPAGVILMLAAWLYPARRWRNLLVGGSVVGLFLALQIALRFLYYGEILPNTYYLKLIGFPVAARIAYGALNAGEFAMYFAPPIFAVAVAVPFLKRDRAGTILLSVFLGQLFYSVYVGGDAWEHWLGGSNRYLTVAMPLFFVLVALAIVPRSPAVRPAAIAAAAAICVVAMSCVRDREISLRQMALVDIPSFVGYERVELRRALILDRVAGPRARIATAWAGTMPYFCDRPSVDLLGKSDKIIARLPMRRGDTLPVPFVPGHMKWDYAHSIGLLQPDIVAGLAYNGEEAEPFLVDYTKIEVLKYPVWLRRQSPNIDWRAVASLEPPASQ